MMWNCWSCYSSFDEADLRSELPQTAVMTMDDNELRKRMIHKCPLCGSTDVQRETPEFSKDPSQ